MSVVAGAVVAGATGVHSVDVDDGHVAFVVQSAEGDAIALASPGAAELHVYAVPAAINQLQAMYRAR